MLYVQILILALSLATSASGSAALAPIPSSGTKPHSAPKIEGDGAASEAPRLNYAVYGDNSTITGTIEAALAVRFRSAGVYPADKLPSAKLILYVMEDANSNINKSGVTIAVAYVSNAVTANFTAEFIEKHGGPPPDVLLHMLRQDGFLYRLNTAHIDNSSAQSLNEVADTIASAFLQYVGVKR